MYRIPKDRVTKWVPYGQKYWCPQSIDINCGHCGRLATFPITSENMEMAASTLTAVRRCPGCDKTVRFYILDPGPASDSSKKGCSCIAVYPEPFQPRESLAEGQDTIPAKIFPAYVDVVKVYNAGVWTAAATCCRRTLEGIISDLLSEDKQKGNLAADLETLAKDVDLKAPLMKLSDTIRKAGNLGAHFDTEVVPDEATAKAMLDLIEYLLEYLYILPKQIDALEARLKTNERPNELGRSTT